MNLKEAIDLLNFRDKIFYNENEFTENNEIAELYLKSIDSAQRENSNVSDNETKKELCPNCHQSHPYVCYTGNIPLNVCPTCNHVWAK